jgi:hypothetical protein
MGFLNSSFKCVLKQAVSLFFPNGRRRVPPSGQFTPQVVGT